MVTETPQVDLSKALEINAADDVWEDLEEPAIRHRETFEFKSLTETYASGVCEVKYLPSTLYLNPRSFKNYLIQFKDINVLPATMIKLIVMDLAKTLSPVTLQCELTVYMDGTTHTLVLGWEQVAINSPVPTNSDGVDSPTHSSNPSNIEPPTTGRFPDIAPVQIGKPDSM